MKRLFCLLVCSLLVLTGKAYTLTGNITNEKNEKMPYISVYVKDAKTGATTDLDGNYRIPDLEAGRHTVVVSYIGYGTQTVEIDLQHDEVRDFIVSEQAYTMSEIFVTPTGESIERFILRMVVENYKKLSTRVEYFDRVSTGHFEQRNNVGLDVIFKPAMGAINTLFGIIGLKGFFQSVINHPDMEIDTKAYGVFQNGFLDCPKSKCSIVHSTPTLNAKELKSWINLTYYMQDNGYDRQYREMGTLKKKVDKMFKKNADEAAKHFSYGGAYDEGEHVVHIIKFDKNEYHVVDGCWQLRRIIESSGDYSTDTYDFCEIVKGLYMIVSHREEFDFYTKEDMRKDYERLQSKDPSELSDKEKKTLDAYKRRMNAENTAFTIASSINYSNFKLKGAEGK